ncbi:MAG: pseudaminic acid cytidylyltransferase [Lewinellaceae bacterium]|nr:pseudaminic acid cytidylyltransferase [Lewinellaceae bacterium]
MKNLAVITARGGSKRIPRKNIRDFLGKPIIAYSIQAALDTGLFDEVMVSTEDEEIAEIARHYGAKVPFLRSEKTADDFATTADVLMEVLLEYSKTGTQFQYLCCIYPTAPLLKPNLVQEAFELLINKDFETVFPVLKFSFPIQRALKVGTENKAEMFYPEHLNTRSQDLQPAFHDSGQFYWLRVDRFLQSQKLLTENTGVIPISEMEAQDIDNLEDWQLAELKYKLLNP